jgi:PAS domain S-box-containing protein
VPPTARWYILSVIALGALTFALLIKHAAFAPLAPLLFFVALSSLFSAFKVQFPIASGSNMSLSYIVDIAALILRGPHATMIVGAATGWSQSTFKVKAPNPLYRTLFNMACLVLTVQASGQVFQRLGGTADLPAISLALPLLGMAVTYFFVNTIPIAMAIALTTNQRAWGVWRSDFAPNAGSYLIGAIAAVVIIKVTQTSGYWLTLALAAPPLYLTYRMYRSGAATEARQGAILEAAHDAIITMDQHLNIREFNPAAEQMFGYDRMQILGRNVDFLLPANDRETQIGHLMQYMVAGDGPLAGRQLEMNALRADGAVFPVELTVARVSGDPSALITGFMRDATERRTLEEQLRQSQKLEAIGRLAGGVAHDFNNVLMSILGSADLLLMELPAGDAARAEVTEIKESVRRGASLTRQLLAFSRRQVTSPRVFDLGEVIASMDTMLRRLIGPEIEFEIARRSQVTVLADPAQIEQVVLNLVINGRDAMPEGGHLVVSIDEVKLNPMPTAQAVVPPGRYARLTVSDTGTGISEQTRARLFEPFFTTKPQDKGTGLGLSIVYGIVKQNGGHIAVWSEPGNGAMFVIDLPAVAVGQPMKVLA